MNILAVQRLALRRASAERLLLHTRRLDYIACRWGYGNTRLNKAEANRAAEFRKREATTIRRSIGR